MADPSLPVVRSGEPVVAVDNRTPCVGCPDPRWPFWRNFGPNFCPSVRRTRWHARADRTRRRVQSRIPIVHMADSAETAPGGAASGASATSAIPDIRLVELVKRYGDVT